MHREPKGSPSNHYLNNLERPVPTSYDSPHEHSWEHWIEVRQLVEEEEDEVSAEDLIRQRAYALYEQRGKEDGFDVDDWLQAEAECDEMWQATAA